MTGETLTRCPRILAFKMAANALGLGVGAGQRVKTVVKIIADEETGFGFDSVLGVRFRIGGGHDLRR